MCCAARIADMLRDQALDLGAVRFFVLDEADRLVDQDGLEVVMQLFNALPKGGAGTARLQVWARPVQLPSCSAVPSCAGCDDVLTAWGLCLPAVGLAALPWPSSRGVLALFDLAPGAGSGQSEGRGLGFRGFRFWALICLSRLGASSCKYRRHIQAGPWTSDFGGQPSTACQLRVSLLGGAP